MTTAVRKSGVIIETKAMPVEEADRAAPRPSDWKTWIEGFKDRHGRAPRILHVGNVANNAYNNAKVLVEAGFECDVVCYDYYHIMGCPEWEDADFAGMVQDHFLPNWREVDLRGFRRPRWFAQGPRFWVIAYLIARSDNRRKSAALLWRFLSFHQWLAAHRQTRWYQMLRRIRYAVARQIQRIGRAYLQLVQIGRAYLRPVHVGRVAIGKAQTAIARGVRFCDQQRRRVIGKGQRVRTRGQAAWNRLCAVSNDWVWPFGSIWRLSLHLAVFPILLLTLVVLVACVPFALMGWALRRVCSAFCKVGLPLREATQRVVGQFPRAAKPVQPLKRRLARRLKSLDCQLFRVLTGLDPRWLDTPEFEAEFQSRCAELIADFDRRFPDRPDRLVMLDMLPYRSVLPLWKELFRRYDLVEAYATDPILCMLTGYEPCVAYEHGTIRDIPFDDNPTARLTALAYARAQGVVITNPDCRQAAERLGVSSFVPIPHLIDRKYYDPKIADDGPLPGEIRPPYIFSPARHDWEVKGTDILIRAFAEIAGDYPDLQLVTPSWGLDIERSRTLIAELGLADRVAMIEPLNIHNLIRVTRAARALVDQFRFGVFGGIGPTALAVGTPLITHLDHVKSDWCMEPPPYFEARDVPSCARALRQALQADAGKLRASLRAWMRRNYWHGQVVDRHATLFAQLIDQHERSTP
ncbi:MAG: hypothetical protein D6695_06925 [Planctomycetota bacterium]|nr:MAG: hypothetical protein D6695_06925 [Planctomycetota bacterium]